MRAVRAAITCALVLAGCQKEADNKPGGKDAAETGEAYVPDYDGSTCRGDFVWTSWSDRSQNGVVDATVALPDGRSFLMTVEAQQSGIVTMASAAVSPDGQLVYTWDDWNNTEQNYSYAVYPETAVATLNYPVRDSDVPYTGGTWEIELFTLDGTGDYIDNVPVDIRVYVAQDDTLSGGCVFVRLVYAGGTGDDPAVTDAVERAVARWSQVWAAHGLKLIPTGTASSRLDADIPSPRAGHDDYADLSEDSDAILQVVIGETIDGETALGESGSIPGSLAATPYSAVAISWLAHAGVDGVFSDAEVRTMGETMAHEASHYLGLFHPVELSGDTPRSYDALDDTPACTSRDDCDELLGRNLMYPYATDDDQDELSSGQVGVLNLWTGTQ
ncbi:MAG: hypothetical protein ACI8S6_003571 [Myxococcota bacterium]|jgi:hypothetical protein